LTKKTQHTCFHQFSTSIEEVELPKKFTFPFYYQAHPLAKLAAKEVQQYLSTQTDFDHEFGLKKEEKSPIGKMFGVLVVKNQAGKIGFLAAFSDQFS
jgi:tRNA pseudouridine32 synthase/23S rRNA pseudouridine746 synthase